VCEVRGERKEKGGMGDERTDMHLHLLFFSVATPAANYCRTNSSAGAMYQKSS
jgi:hypothetical protein